MDDTPDVAAAEAADRAELAADEAASSAEEAIIAARLAKLEAEEAATAAQTTALGNVISAVQSRFLMWSCAMLLVGAALGHVLSSAFS